MQFSLTKSDRDRFWSKVRQSGGCWIWTAGLSKSGYGKFAPSHRQTVGAHRVSYELFNGEIPDGMCVLHRCDNPPCVNPHHLFLGTQVDNVADRNSKNRQARGPNLSLAISLGQQRGNEHWTRRTPEKITWRGRNRRPEHLAFGQRNGHYTKPECTPRGVNAGNAKLTDEKVKALRMEYLAGEISQDKLAAKYGICQSVTSAIILRRTWRHVI